MDDASNQERVAQDFDAKRQIDPNWMVELVNAVPGTAMFRFVEANDGQHRFEFMSDAFEPLTGYPASLPMEHAWALFLMAYDDDIAGVLRELCRARKTRTNFDSAFRLRRKDGTIRWMRCRASPKTAQDGTLLWSGSMVDETAIHEALQDKQRAQRALAESEERLRLAFEASEDGFWDMNPQTNEGILSPRTFRVSGHEPGELENPIGKWPTLIHPDDYTASRQAQLEHYKGNAPMFDAVYRVRHKQGHWVHVRSRAKVVKRDEEGRPIRVVGTLTDVSREKKLEAELVKLAMVARETPSAVSMADPDGRIEWLNEPSVRMAGLPKEQLIGMHVEEIAAALFADTSERQRMLDLVKRKEPYEGSGWISQPGGQRIFANIEIKPIFNENGDLVAYLNIAQDLTPRALTEEKLRASEERLREAQSIARLGSWRYDVATGKVHWSEQLCQIMCRNPNEPELWASDYLARLESTDRAALEAHLKLAIENGSSYESRHVAKRFDGSEGHFLARGNVRRNEKGDVFELYGTCQDVTDQVLAEKERLELHEQLLAGQRLESLGLLAGGIAHDFNNLLMGVLMEASVLSRQTPPETPAADGLDNIQRAAKRMAELTSQLLSYAGRGQFIVEKLDPNAIVTDMLELLRRNVNQQASLESEISREPAMLEIDGSQLRQVIMNLVLNASDALEEKPGRIAVRTYSRVNESGRSEWYLEVKDSGVGMSGDIRKRIFDPFFTTKKNGRGLGLSTVHGIVQRSKGAIHVESTLGRGTTFVVHLPIVEGNAPDAPVSSPEQAKPRAIRVLLADDEAMVRRSIRRMLELLNATVVEVADGAAAIDAIRHATEPFDLALVDVVMPRNNGHEVLQEIHLLNQPTKVVLMSGYNHITAIANGGNNDHRPDASLQKPFDWMVLERIIQSVLDQNRVTRT